MTLSQGQRTISKQSENIIRTSNETLGNNVTILFPKLEPGIYPIIYSASAIAQTKNDRFEFGGQVDGIISRDLNCKYVKLSYIN